jgi:hypothetical protein
MTAGVPIIVIVGAAGVAGACPRVLRAPGIRSHAAPAAHKSAHVTSWRCRAVPLAALAIEQG